MKRYKIILASVLVLLIVVGIGAYFVLDDDEKEKIGYKDVFDCQVSDVIEYAVSDKDTEFVLVKSEDGWKVRDNEKAVLDQAKVEKLVGNAALVTVQDIDSEIDSDEFEAFEKKEVNIGLLNGQKHKFEFAELNKDQCALRVSGQDEIYIAHSSLMNILAVKLDDIRVPHVFDSLAGTEEQLSYYSFVDFDKSKTVIRTKTASEIAADDSSIYIMEVPYRRNVDDDLFEQQIAVKLPNLAAKSYIDDPEEDDGVYGLDKESRAELLFRFGDEEYSLYLGNGADGQIYATRENSEGIFVMSLASVEFLHTEPFFVLEKGIIKESIQKIAKIDIIKGEESFEIRRLSKSDGTSEFFVNGKAASEDSFNRIISEVDKIQICGELINVPEITGGITVNIDYADGRGRQKILFVQANEKEYAMFVNNTAEFAVNKDLIDGFLEELKIISKNPLKAEQKG